MGHIVAQSYLEQHQDTFIAVGILLAAFLAVALLDRVLVRRARRLTLVVTGTELSRETATRLRFLRRAVEAGIILVGIALALGQFSALDQIGRALLASGAIAAAIVGFAARQTLANAVAGILLAVVQPIRIGDLVTFEGETGTIEDVGLTYTWMRTGADARVVIPNERLAAGVLRNDSIRSPTISCEVSVWIGAGADETRALEAVEAAGARGRIAEATADGLRILAIGDAAPATERLAREGDLRAAVLRALREAGVR